MYKNPQTLTKENKIMNNKAKRPLFLRIADWLLNLVLIVSGGIILWLLLIITTFSFFKVPTGSMEPAILPGDNILVNKWLIGARIFDVWEQNKKLSLKGDSVWLGDSLILSYRFKENYYFMAGDRVTSSRDSRYWGLLPEPYIVGIATLIWKSIDQETGKTRWGRVMKAIE